MKQVASHGCMKQACLPQVTTGQEDEEVLWLQCSSIFTETK